MNSITKRWVRGSLFLTIAVALIAEGVFLFFMITGYYNYVAMAIEEQFTNLRASLSLFEEQPSDEKALRLIQAVEQFEDKSMFELMLIDQYGNVQLTSSGVLPPLGNVQPDVSAALNPNTAEQARYIGKNEYGEKVMAITERTPYSTRGIVAMRLVTSMEKVDKTIWELVIASMALFVVIIMAGVISGVYFIRSIVLPLQRVEATASRIAQGDFDNRIEVTSNDEIGSLCKTINNMAEELSKNDRLKNEFITSVSHELRTPLTSIKGWTETVGNIANPSDPSFRRGVEIISGETDRLYDMVEELLDFSKMQNGLELKPELLDLAAEVEDAVLLIEKRASTLGVDMQYNAPELPVPVLGDSNRIRQVLVNVLDNAVKYSSRGKNIYVEILQEGSNAFVTVTDEGQGILPEDLENVKIKFFKGKGAVRGSGIGLAVADEIMQAHGGALDITSEYGAGTKVMLRFPLFLRKRIETQPV